MGFFKCGRGGGGDGGVFSKKSISNIFIERIRTKIVAVSYKVCCLDVEYKDIRCGTAKF